MTVTVTVTSAVGRARRLASHLGRAPPPRRRARPAGGASPVLPAGARPASAHGRSRWRRLLGARSSATPRLRDPAPSGGSRAEERRRRKRRKRTRRQRSRCSQPRPAALPGGRGFLPTLQPELRGASADCSHGRCYRVGFCNAVFPSGWSLPSPRCFIPPSTPPRPFRVGLSGPGCGAAGEVGEGGRNPNLGPLKLPRP